MSDNTKQLTLWDDDPTSSTSKANMLIRTLREQLAPHESENRVKYANGKALKYYVYGRPLSGGVIISKDEKGFNTITDKALLGVFESEEEAKAFQDALRRKINGNG
jgi:hypothetical protein